MTRPQIYLASASPRRSQLLQQIDISHAVRPVAIDEAPRAGEEPAAYVLRLAEEKARALWASLPDAERLPVLAADTTVALDGRDPRQARRPRRGPRHARAPLRAARTTSTRRSRCCTRGRWRARVQHQRGELPRALARRRSTGTGAPASPPTRRAATRCRARPRSSSATSRGSYSGVMGLPLHETWELLAPVLGLTLRRRRVMSTEMVVNVSPRETRAALLENGVLQELFVERASKRGLTGNLYKGRVSRVLPGMQAAFIDIGLERTAFLHVSDIVQPRGRRRVGRRAAHRQHPRPGGRGRRHPGAGAEGSARHQGRAPHDVHHDPLALPGVHAVRPRRRRVGAHRERGRARSGCARPCRPRRPPGETGGYIVRTAAEGASAEALRADTLFLRRLWEVLSAKARDRAARARSCTRTCRCRCGSMRDLVGEGVDRVLVDNERTCERMQRIRGDLHAGARRRASSATPAAGRSSTCTASRRRSSARSTARWR